MNARSVRHIAGFCLIGAVLTWPSVTQASLTVHSGWDLLVTVPSGTEFMGQNWQGVPIGNYNFGGNTANAGIADTIIYRPQSAQVLVSGESATVLMEVAALQMRSVNPFDPDGGGPAPLSYYYITLAGPSSGTVTINFDHEPGTPPHGWFSTEFDVNYALHLGSLDGDIVASGTEGFKLNSGYWNHEKVNPGGGVPLISGVNYLLNGADTSEDFHLAFGPNGAGQDSGCNSPWYQHLARYGYDPAKHGVTECPEPSTMFVGALLLLPFGASTIRMLRKHQAA
jgi:hypothetical protein